MSGKVFFLIFGYFSSTANVFGQDSTLHFNSNLLGAVSSGQTPFWLRSNTYGSVPARGPFIQGELGLHRVYNVNNPRFFQFSAGAQLVANAAPKSSLFFKDLFVAEKAGPIELSVGLRAEFTGLADSALTSGSMAISGNARTYPKIQLSTPRFVHVIPGVELISFKFSYSDGLLGPATIQYGNVSHVPQIYLHQKLLYFRLGAEKHFFNLYGGFNHQAIWGGEERIFSGGLRKSIAYKYVVFGKPWANSRVGNHFGTIDFGFELKSRPGSFLFYRQNIYDDGSLIHFSNISDGLNGIRFKNSKRKNDGSLSIDTALLELVYTKSQGGSVFDYFGGIFGNDNYFNHYVYRQGWSYRGRSLGTPLIDNQHLTSPLQKTDTTVFTSNNRITALHTGITASYGELIFIVKGTYSKNFGTYKTPYNQQLNQLSFIVSAEKPISIWKRSLVSVSLAADIGKLYPNNWAVAIGWKRNGYFR